MNREVPMPRGGQGTVAHHRPLLLIPVTRWQGIQVLSSRMVVFNLYILKEPLARLRVLWKILALSFHSISDY